MEQSKTDELMALIHHINAINDAIKISADKTIELSVIGEFDLMARTLSNFQNAIKELNQSKSVLSDALNKESVINYLNKNQ